MREPREMIGTKLVGKMLAGILCCFGVMACYATVQTGPTEECRTVEVRNRHDVEVCVTRCGDEGCRSHCREREQWSRQHRCWVD
jgi:hypothetical protein